MVGNLKKTVIFFKFPTVFLRKKKEKVRVGEGKKLPSPCLVLILVDCVLKKSCYRLSINVKKQTILS